MMPFTGPAGVGDARVRLEQVEPKRFVLLEGFRYRSPATGKRFEVTPKSLHKTDLASVPFLMRWFVNSYGRHTLPALLHDCLGGRALRLCGDAGRRTTPDPAPRPTTSSSRRWRTRGCRGSGAI